ncbi:hypothetical protein QAD02_009919 [Eretmocerus hayati]|uniref:Uncharacterized protein n=1 Tax=Eretmocerus hayati TaxID=131215 RepID=A0ACC2NB19_9HYME|nr:hypothetical protein QAD02_009919 [Eretmocerus hayati]
MSKILILDKKWKAAQANRLRVKNFRAKRKILDANLQEDAVDVDIAKESRCSQERATVSSAFVEGSNATTCNDERESHLYKPHNFGHQVEATDQDTPRNDDTLSNNLSGQVQAGCDNSGHDTSQDPVLDIVEDVKLFAKEFSLPYNHVDGLLTMLKPHHPVLPLTSRTLMGPRKKYLIEDFPSNRTDSKAEFVYFGVTDTLLKMVNPVLHPRKILKLQFSFDGLPLFGSSKVEFWPILGKIYTENDDYRPFVVAIYSGVGKPKCVYRYLWKFINEINYLLRNGIKIENEQFCIELMAMVADTPARAFVKCCQGHTGYHGCERCTIVGFRVDGTTIFPVFETPPRTDASFRSRLDPDHHTGGVSPLLLINPAVDMIKIFIIDFMHLVCLGVMKKLIDDYWLKLCLGFLTRQNIEKLSQRLKISQLPDSE